MVIRLPDAGEGQLWSESVTPDPLADVTPEIRDGLAEMQGQDDDLFVSTSLADLATSHRAEAERRQREAMALDPDAGLIAADGFARSVEDAFRRDVEGRLSAFGSLQGPKPSEAALQRLREQAEPLRQSLQVKAVTAEDRIRKQAQLGLAERTAAALMPLVRDQPDALDEAAARLDDLGRAIRPLAGDEAADAFIAAGKTRLADSALSGLGELAPDMAASALSSGAFDGYLDPAEKRRRLKASKDSAAARQVDEGIVETRLKAEQVSRRQAQALGFATTFTGRLAAGEAALTEELVRAEADGIVAPAQAARLRKRLTEAETARAGRETRAGRIAKMLEGGRMPDPDRAADRDDVTLYFEEILKPELDALPPAGRIGFIRDLPNEIGFLPEAAICPLAGAVLTGAAEDRVAAAKTLTGIVERQPDAEKCLPPGMVPMARLFGDLDRFGIDAETAASWIDDPDSIRNPALRDMLFIKGRDDGNFVTAFQHMSEPVEPTSTSNDAAEAPSAPDGGGGEAGGENSDEGVPITEADKSSAEKNRFDSLNESSPGLAKDVAADGDGLAIGGAGTPGIVSGISAQTEAERSAARKNFEEGLGGDQTTTSERSFTARALSRGGKKTSDSLDVNTLKETRRTLEELAKKGRESGRPVSADLVDHYLKGSGETVVLDKDWVREYPPALNSWQRTEEHFEGWLKGRLRDKEKYGEIGDWLKSNNRRLEIDKMKWEAVFGGGSSIGSSDQANAIGGGTIIGIGKLILERVGDDTVRVSGTVSQRLDDTYDFAKGDSGKNEWLAQGAVAGDPLLNRKRITKVEDAGGVKKFKIESTPRQRKLSGELTIKGDTVIGADLEWTDLD